MTVHVPEHTRLCDLMSCTAGLPVSEDIIQFVVRGDGRVTGEAFVSFSSTSESEVSRYLWVRVGIFAGVRQRLRVSFA